MKKKFILIPFIGVLLYVLLSSYSEGPAITAGIEGTGATGSAGCSCHNASSTSSTTVSIQLLSGGTPVTTYVPGNTYTIQITGTQTSSSLTLPRFGFQLMVVKSSGAGSGSAVSTGTFGTAPSGTHTYSLSGRTIFEHYNGGSPGAISATTGSGGSGTTYVESISWTAPAAGTGSVVIYGVINAVNYNGTDDAGDKWNNNSLTICESVGSITGTPVMCAGGTTTLNCTPSGGTWSSGSTGVATITSGGIVSGLTGAGGTSVISYNAGCSGTATQTVTVNALPAAIGGLLGVCSGATTTLTDASTPGTWTSISPSIATITSGGLVSGVSTTGGTSLISFTQTSTGCSNTAIVTVNPLPSNITGAGTLCQGATLSLSETSTGGTWSSGSTGVATVSSGGVVTGVVTGSTTSATSVITYTSAAGCSVSATVTVNPLPSAISGGTSGICPGGVLALSDPSGTGTWVSGSTGVATIISGTGVVTGVSPAGGTSVITFTLPLTGCTATKTITVNPAPGAITGSLTLCPGGSSTLSDLGGGTWLSGSTSVATIGSASGSVNGITTTGGTSIITYTLPVTGCTTTAVVTVTATPAPIAGPLAICQGASATLTEGVGTWTSSNTGIATIGSSSGVVSGVVTGGTGPATSLITFVSSGGCTVSATVTVNPAPAAIGGATAVCAGSSISLTDATGGGSWTSSDNSIATVGSTGNVNGLVASSVNITYTLPGSGCFAVAPVVVNPLPSPIGGATNVCSGSSVTLTDGGSGSWTSGDPTIASIGAISGSATGVSTLGGTVLITYTLPVTGCSTTTLFTVNPLPSAISGPAALCAGGSSYTLSDGGGGTWASSNTTVAPITSSGVINTGVTGIEVNATITYTLLTGCSKTTIVSVNPLPGIISGSAGVCVGSSTTLTDGGGGVWASSDGTIASAGSNTGIITGVAIGTATITYTLPTGCLRVATETVNPAASAISGPFGVCRGATTTLTDGGGGTWTSSNTTIAPIGSASGTITGGAVTTPVTATITYTLLTGCSAIAVVTVNPISAITGVSSICSGLTTLLADATTGGTWSSSDASVAAIGSSSGSVFSGTPGSAVITYTTAAGCTSATTLSVISSPAPIAGSNEICLGSPNALSDAGGGLWTSSAPATASVGSTGIVTGLALGTATISYSLGTGCTVVLPVTVNAAVASISGATHVCVGASTTLTDVGTGTWTSSDGAIAGVGATGSVSGVAGGVATITYTLSSGCAATKAITVNALPAAISGQLNICIGTTTPLSDVSGTGAWVSSAGGIASVAPTSGSLTGIAIGTTNITFTETSTGCAISAVVTVNAVPPAITGPASVCQGSAVTELDGSGTWSISNTNATIGSGTGTVTGIAAGTSVVTYTSSIGCNVLRTITINTLPPAIGGSTLLCANATASFTDGSTGGTWSIAPTSVGTVAATSGVVTGISTGTALLTYTLATGCAISTIVTVNPAPSAISGTTHVCAGGSVTLTDAGGSWSSSPSTIAGVDAASGLVTGFAGGSAVITYTLPTGCTATVPFTVYSLPGAISGPGAVCIGSGIALTDGGTGTWSSSDITEASVGSISGVVTGISSGTPLITYTVASSGCQIARAITVNVLPGLISGTAVFCAGDTATLSDGSGGGVWASSSSTAAGVGSATGFVTTRAGGTPTISYTLPTGCSSTYILTINALPATIGGTLHVCNTSTTTLSETGGGTWASSNTAVAGVGSASGLVSAVAVGTATITYTLPTGCMCTAAVTVNPLPDAGTVAGASSVCVGARITLTDTATGGIWTSLHTATATVVPTTGVVLGVVPGVDTINYRVTNSCGADTARMVVTVNPLAVSGSVSGATIVCMSAPVTLADTVSGGVWSSGNTAVATVGASSGVVSGVSAGIVSISYSVTNICNTAVAIFRDTVVALPSPGTIAGEDSVCAGSMISLTDTAIGGTWTTSNGNATVSPTGVVTGIAAGTDTIGYSLSSICGPATAQFIVHVKAAGTCNTGVAQVASSAVFNVYPNPSTGTFTIEIPQTVNGSVVTICDVLGKVIDRRVISDHTPQQAVFNLSNVAPGSYIIRVDAGDMTYRNKIVIW